MNKKCLSFILVLISLTACQSIKNNKEASEAINSFLGDSVEPVNAEIIGGNCGDNVKWSYNTDTKTIEIYGSGSIESYEEVSMNSDGIFVTTAPWKQYAKDITSCIIKEGVEYIGQYAFQGCTNLKNLSLPISLTTIGNGAFSYCSKLKRITLPDSLFIIGGLAFSHCTSLDSIHIPNSVHFIGYFAFASCTNLQYVTMSNQIHDLGSGTFSLCEKIKEIHVSNKVPIPTDAHEFSNVWKTCKLYVPKGSLKEYRSAPVWKEFKHIVEE